MSADVTTTHDKYEPFTRAELQALGDRAEWLGANLIDPHAARAHLDLAQAADHLDAIRARAEAGPALEMYDDAMRRRADGKPDLKLYDPNADTDLWAEADAHAAGRAQVAAPGPLLQKHPLGVYPGFLWWEEHPTPSAAERESRRRDILAAIERHKGTTFEPLAEWFTELELLKSEDARPDPGESASTEADPADLRRSFASAVPAGAPIWAGEDRVLAASARLLNSFTGTVHANGFAIIADDPPGIFQRLAERTRGLIVDRIARRNGAKHAAVEAALTEATRDRPLWQWLRDGGLERLIALVVSLLPLFV